MTASILASAPLMALTSQVHADWRKEIGKFRIGIATKDGEPFKAEALEGFRLQVMRSLAMPVEIFQARSASSLIDAAASSRIEYAILSSLGFVTLDLTCDCVSPLVAPTSQDGATMIRSVLFVDSNKIASLDDLSGKKIAVGSENSLTGSILPHAQFKLNGVSLRQSGLELVQATKMEEAVEALASGEIDGFFGWDQTISNQEQPLKSSLSAKLENYPNLSTASIWTSDPIRFGPHVIHNSVPAEAANLLKDMLENLHETAPLAYQTISPDLSGGFERVTAQDYIAAFALVRDIARNASAEPTVSIAK